MDVSNTASAVPSTEAALPPLEFSRANRCFSRALADSLNIPGRVRDSFAINDFGQRKSQYTSSPDKMDRLDHPFSPGSGWSAYNENAIFHEAMGRVRKAEMSVPHGVS